MQNFIEALRPKRYLKNLLVLVPLILSTKFLDFGLAGRALLAFVVFSVTASATYIINDLFDREKDKSFGNKKERAITAGDMHASAAVVAALLLATAGVVGGFFVSAELGLTLMGYLVLSLWYSAWFQHIAVLDVVTSMALTTLRVVAGSLVLGLNPSPELMFAAASLGLLLALGQKVQDKRFVSGDSEMPLVIKSYSSNFLEHAMVGAATLFITAFSLFIFSATEAAVIKDNSLFYGSILLVFVAYRYVYVVLSEQTKSPKKDIPLLLGALLFVIVMVGIFYLAA